MHLGARIALSIVVGYLLGCLSPSYVLGRLLKGIDLRKVGLQNAGARNAWTILGWWPGIVTAVIDLAKGVAAVLLCRSAIGLPQALIVLPASAAIAGHIAPFWLAFRGGKGTATAIGLWLYIVVGAIVEGRFPLASLAALLAVALLAFLASRTGEVAGMAAFLSMLLLTPLELGCDGPAVLAATLAAFILASVIRDAILRGVFRLERQTELRLWRLVARPFGLLFIPIDLLWGRRPVLLLLGGLTLLFVAMDLVRIASRLVIARMYKSTEVRSFSSMSLFLISIFTTFLVFPAELPYLPLAFSTVGDLCGKLLGLRYGRTRLYKDRTLQGSLGFMTGALLTGWIVYRLVPMPVVFVLAGVPFSALVELLSEHLDDNFSVSLLSGVFLFSLRTFLGV